MKKTALVTGGSRGIGFGIARALAAAGFHLAINGVRDQRDVQDQLDRLTSYGVGVTYCQGDIGVEDDRKRIVGQAIAGLKVIGLLVNNAGVAPRVRNDITEATEEDFDYVMNINLKGTFFMTQEVVRHMLLGKQADPAYPGMIINITSVSAYVASINRAAYCMAKAGLAMGTKLWASRLGPEGIPVYEVQPGIIDTDMTSGVKEKYDNLIRQGLMLEPRWGTPDDIGTIVATLATGGLPYSTGQVIRPDGGMGVPRL